MKARERLWLVIFLLAVFSLSHAMTSRSSNTACSSCAYGYAVHFTADFGVASLK
jgi:hypothetical protein